MLSPEEIEQLRRISWLSQFGELPVQMQELLEELRSRDDGSELVAPTLDIQVIPAQRIAEDALDNLLDDDLDCRYDSVSTRGGDRPAWPTL
jgi:hypothetical protein